MNRPSFKKLTIDDKDIIENFAKKFPPYSDFSFFSLFTYNTNEDLEYAFHNNNLIVKFSDYLTGERFYSVLGENKVKETKELLFSLPDGKNKKMSMVPDSTIGSDSEIENFFEVIEERDHFDYIVSASDIAELSPEKFPKKQRAIQSLKNSHPNLVAKSLELKDKKTQQEVLRLFDKWQSATNKTSVEIATELTALERMLNNASHFDQLYAVGIYDNKELVGFNSFDIVHDSYGISSFQKANRKYDGIYALLTHEAAKKMVELGCQYINFEQDLGIEGLRSSKNSWHPVKYLKKYSVTPKRPS